jgi:hypothetical protein
MEQDVKITRHQFLRRIAAAGGSAAAMALQPFRLAATADADTFHVALIADTHIIDEYYKGPEPAGTPADSESLFHTTERLEAARATINRLRPAIEKVFLLGDIFHNYPSADVDFHFARRTRIDRAMEILSGFRMPVHAGFGNHDYGDGAMPRAACHEIFRRKLGLSPYYSVDYRGWKFVHLNNFAGDTWNSRHPAFDVSKGSLGETQLQWFESELRQQKPTFVFVHYPLPNIKPTELRDYGLHALLKRHSDTVQRVVSGHWHRWFNFGRTYGPSHLVMGSTRYDPDAYLIVQASTKTGRHEVLNLDLVDWNAHFSEPYAPGPRGR